MLTGKRTKIVCTQGPATDDDEIVRQLIRNGMNVARFNFSHGSHEEHTARIERIRRVSREEGVPVAIMLDTKGPEIRTGELVDHQKVMLTEGSTVVVTTDACEGTSERFSLDYETLPSEVEAGSVILIDDGLIGLRVVSVKGNDITCEVTNGGELGEHKGVNLPNIDVNLPAVTETDIADIIFGCELGIDAIAASFIRDAEGVETIRQLCGQHGLEDVAIFPKIESSQGVRNFDAILAAADGIMVARGDLGVEVPAAEVPHLQKQMIRKCNEQYKPVITATQMLDSMIRNPRPTRAEVTDVANAIYDGTDCVMLSGETANGKYPVEAVKTMTAICKETERYLKERNVYHEREGLGNVNGAIGFAALTTAERIGAKAILAPTNSGRTARLISNFRPRLPLVAFSPMERSIRKCCFYWGVDAFPSTMQPSLNATVRNALELSRKYAIVNTGDLVVITAGDPGTAPRETDYTTSTNVVMAAQIS